MLPGSRLRPDAMPWRGSSHGPFVDPHESVTLPAGRRLRVRWLGTAGYELSHDGTTLLVDPYVTRAGLAALLARPLVSDSDAVSRHIGRADAILAGHSHFDHALDIPAIALCTGATVYGSRSVANLCRAAGVPAQKVVAIEQSGGFAEVGSFRVRFVPSLHNAFLFGSAPLPGEIPAGCTLPMRVRGYRAGAVFGLHVEAGGVSFYHTGSANLVDDAIRLSCVDVLAVCISARRSTERFTERIIRQTRPRRVLPMHYDDFTRPLDAGMRLLPGVAFDRFVDDVASVDPGIEVQTIGLLQTVVLRTS